MGRYLCINCKVEFDKIPDKKNNECPFGHDHVFVEKKHLIKR